MVGLSVRNDIRLPKDSAAIVTSESLLGGKYLSLQPGGDETMLQPGQTITITQSSVSLEELLGKFIFSITNAEAGREPAGSGEAVIPPPPKVWPQADGAPVSCREKLRMLAENHAELVQALQDAFEDAVLMGVDESAMRRILTGVVEGLRIAEASQSMKLRALAAVALMVPCMVRAQPLPPLTATPFLAPTTQPPIGQPATPPQAIAPPAPQPVQPGLGAAGPRRTPSARQGERAECAAVGEGWAGGALRVAEHPGAGLQQPATGPAAGFRRLSRRSPTAVRMRAGFHGWMLAKNPSVSMLQNPIYDVRVVGCKT